MGMFLLLLGGGAMWFALTLANQKKTWKPVFFAGLLFLFIGFATVGMSSTPSTPTSVAAATDEPVAQPTDEPAADPTADPADNVATDAPRDWKAEERDFLQGVDETVSGTRIAGNPYKFVGSNVDLHCTVSTIPDPLWFNADCGSNGEFAMIVISHDTTNIEKGQRVRIIGTVMEPTEGTNAMGGSMNFPAVSAKFLE